MAFRAGIAFAITLSLLCVQAGVVAHDISVAAQTNGDHAVLAAELTEYHHVHDDGTDDRRTPDLNHKHDSSDHAHDTPGVPPALFVVLPNLTPAAHAFYEASSGPGNRLGHYRPPRAASRA